MKVFNPKNSALKLTLLVMISTSPGAHCNDKPVCEPQSTTCDESSIMLCDDKGRWTKVLDCNQVDEGSTCGDLLGELVCKEPSE